MTTNSNNMNLIPSLDILPQYPEEVNPPHIDEKELQSLGNKIVEVLNACGLKIEKIHAQVGISFYHIEVQLEQDMPISQVKELIGNQLDTDSYRTLITTPYLFNYTIGFEIPRSNPDKMGVYRLLSNPRFQRDERKFIALPLGATINNETFIQSLFLLDGSMLIVGADSSMLRSIYLSLLYKQLPMNRKIMRKANDEPLDKFLLRVADEIMEREHFPRNRDVNLFVFIDNIDSYYPLQGIAKEILDVLLTQGEGLNIYSIISTRKVERDTLFLHERIRAHCVFSLPSEDSTAIIGNDNAAYLAPNGECYWQVDDEEPIRLSTPTVSEETLNSVLEQVAWMQC